MGFIARITINAIVAYVVITAAAMTAVKLIEISDSVRK
jgi:hypothetical protein